MKQKQRDYFILKRQIIFMKLISLIYHCYLGLVGPIFQTFNITLINASPIKRRCVFLYLRVLVETLTP